MLPEFDLYLPTDVGDAVRALEGHAGEAMPLAGGTLLMPRLYNRRLRPRLLVDLTRLSSNLGYVRLSGGYLRIGALATISDLRRAELPPQMEALAQAAANFGSWQVRNVATVGGNLAGGSLVGDLITALMAMGARVKVLGRRGERIVQLDRLYGAAGSPDLRTGGIITEAFIEVPKHRFWSSFGKIGRRAANALAIVNAAVYLEVDGPSGRIRDAKIATNAVGGHVPQRIGRAEQELRGRDIADADADAAGAVDDVIEVLEGSLSPRDDFRASADYRREAAKAIVRRLLMYSMRRLEEEADADGR